MAIVKRTRTQQTGKKEHLFLEHTFGILLPRDAGERSGYAAAYGDQVHGLRMTLSGTEQEKLTKLLAETGRASLEDYLANGEFALIDLMDLCDAGGISYSFVGLGDRSGVQFRPAF